MKRLSLFVLFSASILACTLTTPTGTPWVVVVTATVNPPVKVEATAEVNTPAPETTSVFIFFTMAADPNMTPVPVAREVPASNDLATLIHSTLSELMRGPTDAEKAVGLTSWFSAATENSVNGITFNNSDLVVDFTGLTALIPNASTSAGSQMLLSQLNSTVFQFDFVESANYTLEGNCDDFWQWLQMDCHIVTRAEWEAG